MAILKNNSALNNIIVYTNDLGSMVPQVILDINNFLLYS